ncbi:MAG: YkgJ family cysteine cluster protein [Haliea sp.]|nr:MAG: YkgJ family cysteine cluster protein [Haliea sp.]
MSAQAEHPCLACGACCAVFRVDFSAFETQQAGGNVPDGLAVEVTATMRRMRGTDHSPPRCAALTGTLGSRVACGIYEWRPSPCREFEAGSAACNAARARHALPALDEGYLL